MTSQKCPKAENRPEKDDVLGKQTEKKTKIRKNRPGPEILHKKKASWGTETVDDNNKGMLRKKFRRPCEKTKKSNTTTFI